MESRKLITVFTIISAVTICSCTSSDRVRKLAKEHSCESFVKSITELYVCYYHSMPESIEDITGFIDDWRTADPHSYCFPEDYSTQLKKEPSLFAAYKDSVFIYFPKSRLGCCGICTPEFWIDHPEQYPEYRRDYFSHFRPSAFLSYGKLDFNFDYDNLNEILDSLSSRHSIEFQISGYPHRANIIFAEYKQGKDVQYRIPSFANEDIISQHSDFFNDSNDKILELLESHPETKRLVVPFVLPL